MKVLESRLAVLLIRWSDRLNRRANGDHWRPTPTAQGIGLKRMHPRVFGDADNFSMFLRAVLPLHAVRVEVGYEAVPLSDETVAAAVANLGRQDRESMTVRGIANGLDWTLRLGCTETTLVLIPGGPENEALAREVITQVERFTRPVDRFPRERSVISPLGQREALIHEHDRTTRRRAIAWGFVAGAIAGPAVTFLLSLLNQHPSK